MNKTKILIYDIECTAALAYVWSQWDASVIATHTDWHLLSVAYKWKGDKKIHFRAIWDDPKWKAGSTDDRQLTEHLRDLFDEADVLVAHNGDGFDQKKVNARMLFHDIAPPSPYRSVDTLKVVRRNFKNYSNSLKELARLLSLDAKMETGGFGLWLDSMAGDRKAQKKMERYNRQDVVVLEELYDRLTPWITNINFSMYADDLTVPACKHCASDNVNRRGFQTSNVQTYQRWRCMDCGGWSRSRLAERPSTRVQLV